MHKLSKAERVLVWLLFPGNENAKKLSKWIGLTRKEVRALWADIHSDDFDEESKQWRFLKYWRYEKGIVPGNDSFVPKEPMKKRKVKVRKNADYRQRTKK